MAGRSASDGVVERRDAPGYRPRPVGDAPALGLGEGGNGEDEGVRVQLSPAARAFSRNDDQLTLPGSSAQSDESEQDDDTLVGSRGAESKAANGEPLSDEQSRRVEQLRARDVEVRAHEAAHLAAAGGLAGAPSYSYALGPDGKRYAVGGEVSVDTSAGRTPEETIARARTLKSAATAPADPSAQDMAVAAAAAQMEAQAQAALHEQRSAESAPPPSSDEGLRQEAVAAPGGQDGARSPAEAPDPEMLLVALTREQISSRGGFNHSHQTEGCGSCRLAVSAYG